LGERGVRNAEVRGSIPLCSTKSPAVHGKIQRGTNMIAANKMLCYNIPMLGRGHPFAYWSFSKRLFLALALVSAVWLLLFSVLG
jgi:hypothetical protein